MDAVMLAFEEFVEAQWTQISRLYVGEKAQRYNWKQMMDLAESGNAALAPPFAVIEYEEEQEEDFGTCVDSYSMVANAAVMVIGFPPKVAKVSPCTASAISGVVSVAPMGKPFAMPLANVMMSGSTPHCSIPNHL